MNERYKDFSHSVLLRRIKMLKRLNSARHEMMIQIKDEIIECDREINEIEEIILETKNEIEEQEEA